VNTTTLSEIGLKILDKKLGVIMLVVERPLSTSIIVQLMIEVIKDKEFCREITGGYDFYNAGGGHQDNLYWLVEKLAVKNGYLEEKIGVSNMAWGAARHLLYEGVNTNFNRVEISGLGSAFQRLLNDNLIAPGMHGSSNALPFFNVIPDEDNVYLSLLNEKFWELIHPSIIGVSKSRYQAGHFADCVEAAFKEVNSIVKNIYKSITNEERDGADLMRKAFTLNNPQIKLSDLSNDSEKNIQDGYMNIFAGSMIGIRNPKAHENISISKNRAIHFLFLASLLMYKVDERNI
jgi:uncharacterized protein (TIGR02391 family)